MAFSLFLPCAVPGGLPLLLLLLLLLGGGRWWWGAVAGETQFQLLGFLLVMGSSLTSGLRWVLIQVLLQVG